MSFSGAHAIVKGDALATLRELPDNEFDALFCDPPYGLSFMGKKWDYDVPSVDVWRECLRVLKPGAPLLAFGGSRTFHRIAVGIEDAGFELRDVLSWMYGSGFPKSLDVSKAIDKRRDDSADVRHVCRFLRAAMEARGISSADIGRAFDMHSRMVDHWAARDTDSQPNLPTWEQWLRLKDVLELGAEMDAEVWRLNGRKGEPGEAWKEAEVLGQYESAMPGLVGKRFAAHETTIKAPATDAARLWHGYGTSLKPAWEPCILARKPLEGTVASNVAKWGVGGLAIDACRIGNEKIQINKYKDNVAFESRESEGRWPANVAMDEEAGAILDAQAGNRPSTPYRENVATGAVLPMSARTAGGYSDEGGPSRFFYSAKVSTKEREHGCLSLPMKSAGETTDREDGSAGLDSPRAGAGRGGGARNHHPTLKPISLVKWLASLIKPPTADATLLVPFSGAGSEMIGALEAGWPMVFGIEGEQEYIDIAHARIAAWAKGAP